MKTIEICVWRTIYGEMGFSPPISAGYHYSVYDFKYNRRKEAKTVVSKCWSFLFSGDEEIVCRDDIGLKRQSVSKQVL